MTRSGTPLLAALVVFGLGIGTRARSDPGHGLTPPEPPKFRPPRGAVFVDDFKSGHLERWRADRAGVWSVKRGMLKAELPDAKQEHSLLFTGDSTWTDYAMDIDVCGMRGVDKGIVVRVRREHGVGIDLRGPGYQDLKIHLNEFPVGRYDVLNANGVWHHLRVEVRGPRCRVLVDGAEIANRRLSARMPASGGIALAAYTGGVGECLVFYDNIAVTPLDAAADAEGSTR